MEFNITILNNLNMCYIKKNGCKFLVIYSKNYYNKYNLSNSVTLYFNKNCRTLVLKSNSFITSYKDLENIINNNSYAMLNYFVNKITFTGKSYKIKKTNSNFVFEFNKAHIETCIWKNMFIKKLKKSKILLKSSNEHMLLSSYRSLINIRKINPFTQRGLRGSRCILMKKVGKKSS